MNFTLAARGRRSLQVKNTQAHLNPPGPSTRPGVTPGVCRERRRTIVSLAWCWGTTTTTTKKTASELEEHQIKDSVRLPDVLLITKPVLELFFSH